jgi:hypothetical protein
VVDELTCMCSCYEIWTLGEITSVFVCCLKEKCKGEVQLNHVGFRYPTRRRVKVLRNLNITVKPGQTVALVGTSGCGKSTTVSLVERFYDVIRGNVVSLYVPDLFIFLNWLAKIFRTWGIFISLKDQQTPAHINHSFWHVCRQWTVITWRIWTSDGYDVKLV